MTVSEGGGKVEFAVHGMHCQGCVSAINKALKERDGVLANEVSLTDSLAVVTYDPKKVAPADLKTLIEDLGYTVVEKI
jgi:copper chaperone CopZ